ncbi:alanine acetyltransferase [Bacillus sp. LL01]|uniref:ribosomal protein S18-alanine N-acetyltransferase n=1 Tax=Bacillus sp. LL01 TaxID=1665556 RepID=UPI00064D3F74|nr:ribosomal protein S18-alanine N-acetyltransferase [Bacillus sp. LL01]KMJ56691.1 alanine acetyltransferase [Bacillus sp. LL01]
MNSLIGITKMTVYDIEGVHRVELQSFATAWTKDAFYYELTNNPYAHYLVMKEDERVIGYCGIWIVMGEAQITNIAIDPSCRGRKLGDLLLGKAMEYCKMVGATTVSLEVRISNVVAQSLYRKHGFQNGGIRKKYYVDNNEDALVMWVNI